MGVNPARRCQPALPCPALLHVQDALREPHQCGAEQAQSRRGRVQLLMPAAGLGATQLQRGSQPLFSARHTPAAVLHLAATGDHGFSRRLRLAAPLLQQVRAGRLWGMAVWDVRCEQTGRRLRSTQCRSLAC